MKSTTAATKCGINKLRVMPIDGDKMVPVVDNVTQPASLSIPKVLERAEFPIRSPNEGCFPGGSFLFCGSIDRFGLGDDDDTDDFCCCLSPTFCPLRRDG